MPSYRGMNTVVFTTDLGDQEPFGSDEPPCSMLLLHVLATAWCRNNRSDGVIPRPTLARLATWAVDGPSVFDVAARLAAAGRWIVNGDNTITLSDYETMQITTKEMADLSERQSANRLGKRASTTGEPAVNERSTSRQPPIPSRPVPSLQIESNPTHNPDSAGADPGSVEPDPPPSKPATKRRTGDHPEIIQLWEALWMAATGSPYRVDSKDGIGVASLLRTFQRADIEARMRRCLDDRQPEWLWREDKPPTLATFCGNAVFMKLATPLARSPNSINSLPRQKNGLLNPRAFLDIPLNRPPEGGERNGY